MLFVAPLIVKKERNVDMKSKVTMQDIADRLNLSKNSVSQALSGKDGVSEETRRKIMRAADEMGYVYTLGKKKKAVTDSKGAIALIASEFAFSQKNFFGEIYLTIEQEAAKYGKRLLIQSVTREAAESLALPSFLMEDDVDGVMVLSHITTDYINKVIDTKIPTVLIDHHHPRIQADCILTNNRFSAYEAIRHLVELGHTRIGFLGDISISPSYYERLEGFNLAMRDFRITPRDSWLCTDTAEDAGSVMSRVQSLDEQPTAWFCVNDGLGFFLNAALQQLGYQIPADVSIVSFDNGYLSRLSTPPTTTLDVDLKLFGVKAVEQLFKRIQEPGEPYTELLLPTKLLVRESTAAAPEA